MTKFVVIGAGITGLYTVYALTETGVKGHDISVVAEYLPGDESIGYTSPFAGGNFSCISGDDAKSLKHDKLTYTNLAKLQQKLGGAKCGLDRVHQTEYWDDMPSTEKMSSLVEYLEDIQFIDVSRLPPGATHGIKYKSWSFNCPKFLMNMKQYLESQGVRFHCQRLEHITQAFARDAQYGFNCTGLGSRRLGVNDDHVYPTRGQVVVCKAPHITDNTLRWGRNYATYLIKRPYSHDQLILGGFMDVDSWEGSTFRDQSESILQRTTEMVPELLTNNPHGAGNEDLEIIRQAAGLRPTRKGGVRIEREAMGGVMVIHNYGAGGYGYQSGLGMAIEAVGMIPREQKL